jgi:hypothetical protein
MVEKIPKKPGKIGHGNRRMIFPICQSCQGVLMAKTTGIGGGVVVDTKRDRSPGEDTRRESRGRDVVGVQKADRI